ncbi:MAG: hypothetical protein ACXWKG_15705 [Limisphaerales bacterium]
MNLDDDLEEFMSWATEYIHRTIRLAPDGRLPLGSWPPHRVGKVCRKLSAILVEGRYSNSLTVPQRCAPLVDSIT